MFEFAHGLHFPSLKLYLNLSFECFHCSLRNSFLYFICNNEKLVTLGTLVVPVSDVHLIQNLR